MILFGIPAGLFCGIAILVILYLVVDIYLLTPNLTWWMFRNLSFWFLWAFLLSAAVLSYHFLKTTAHEKIVGSFGTQAEPFATAFFAVFASLTVVQSFSLKIADKQLVDIGKFLNDFRVRVLSSISSDVAIREERRRMQTTVQLYEKFKGDPQRLREEYALVMRQAGQGSAIARELGKCEKEATDCGLSTERLMAQKITEVNAEWARDLVKNGK